MLGLNTLIGTIAAMVLYPLAGVIAQHGWRPAFLVHLVALAVIPLVLTLPKGVRTQAHEPAAAAAGRLGLPPALLLVAAYVGMAMFIGGMFSPFYLTSIGITNPALLSIAPTVSAAVGLVVAASYGWLHARLSRMTLFTVALGLVAVGLAISGVSAALPMFVVGAGLAGGGVTLFTPNLSAEAIARAPEGQAGRAVGLASGAIFCSQVVFPFIAMPLVHSAGPRGVYLAFAAVAALFTLGFALVAFSGRGQPEGVRPAPHPV
jgi:MFS family permease